MNGFEKIAQMTQKSLFWLINYRKLNENFNVSLVCHCFAGKARSSDDVNSDILKWNDIKRENWHVNLQQVVKN